MSSSGELSKYLRQVADQAAAEISVDSVFAEEPVSLTIFVQDSNYLSNPPLSDVQYEAVRYIERIYYPHTYPQLAEQFEKNKKPARLMVGPYSSWREEAYWSDPVRMINFATLQWGKGAGKDHICRVASLRIAYLLMCLHSPQDYYGMPQQDTIHLLNVASTSGQAQTAFFTPITRAVRRGWFKDRCEPRMNFINFRKNIEAISGHSDAETQEGLNLMLGIADEIDAFKSVKEMTLRRGASSREPTKSAESIVNMMRTSSATRFPEVFKNVWISYPRYLGSTIQQLTEMARKDFRENSLKSRYYVSGPMATWEVNPRVPGREAFAADYKENPELARSKYECRPSRAMNPYFRNHQAVDACFTPVSRPPIDVDYEIESIKGREVWVPKYSFSPEFYPVNGAIYAMHGDLAVAGDRAGIAMAHVVRYSEHESTAEDEDGARFALLEYRPNIKVDFVIAYEADVMCDPPREIQIRWARQLAFELKRQGFNIRRFTFDAFNSVDSMQILRSHGIESYRVSTDSSEEIWRNLRDLMYEGRVSVPRTVDEKGAFERDFLLREEILSLSKLPTGRIDHPSNSSKDMADALACAVLGAMECGGQEEEGGQRAHYAAPDITVGRPFTMPLGVNLASVWERETPALPV